MTTTAQHTSGPWSWSDRYEDNFGKGMMLLGNGGKGTYICHLYVDIQGKAKATTEKWQANRNANARLIAAAPEQHHALAHLVADIELGFDPHESGSFALAKAALAKATTN